VAIGVDIVEIKRIEESVERFGDKFLHKIFTEREREYCLSKAKPGQHFAARFAAKEAVYKAVGDIEHLDFQQVEVLNNERGKPAIYFHDTEHLRDGDVALSLSHSREYAVAMVSKVSN
jgi:holo-[acyl-carrier protein] synthase